MRVVRHIVAIGFVAWAGLSAQERETAGVLNDMRTALGGDAALHAIESVVLVGTQKRIADAGPLSRRIEVACQLPDEYLRTFIRMGPVRAPNGSTDIEPVGSSFDGFTIDFPIRGSRGAAGRPNGTFITSPAPPAEAERRLTLIARPYQQEFARLMLPLFGTSFGGYAMALT